MNTCCDPPFTPFCRWCRMPLRVSEWFTCPVIDTRGDTVQLKDMPPEALGYFVEGMDEAVACAWRSDATDKEKWIEEIYDVAQQCVEELERRGLGDLLLRRVREGSVSE